jgi:hypothetical protein
MARSSWFLLTGGLFALVGVIALAACGSDGQDESGASLPDVTSATVPTTTSTAPASESFTANVTDASGYTFNISVAAPTLGESIEDERPGWKDVFLEGSVSVENTTAGRNAPFLRPGYVVILKVPEGTCSERLFVSCDAGGGTADYMVERVAMLAPVDLERSSELAIGESVTMEETVMDSASTVPESFDSDEFFWSIDLRNQSIVTDLCGGSTVCDIYGSPWYASDGGSIPEDVVQLIDSFSE